MAVGERGRRRRTTSRRLAERSGSGAHGDQFFGQVVVEIGLLQDGGSAMQSRPL
jgi:hypothetical protein